MGNSDRLQVDAVKRLSETDKEVGAMILEREKELDELIEESMSEVAPRIVDDTVMYDRSGSRVPDTGIPEALGELFVLKQLQDGLQDRVRKQIAKCLNSGIKRFVISDVLGVSSPNLFRAFDLHNADAGKSLNLHKHHTIGEYQKEGVN